MIFGGPPTVTTAVTSGPGLECPGGGHSWLVLTPAQLVLGLPDIEIVDATVVMILADCDKKGVLLPYFNTLMVIVMTTEWPLCGE